MFVTEQSVCNIVDGCYSGVCICKAGSTVYYTAAISSPSEVRAGWNCLVAGSGRMEVSSHTPTAVPAAMGSSKNCHLTKVRANYVYMWVCACNVTSTVISQKSGRTVCICECVTQCDKHCHLTKVRANCVYM